MEIREATSSDAASIATVYNHYVEASTITFEEEAVSVGEMASRIEAFQSFALPWYLAAEQNVTLGYAYATPWKSRRAYRYSSEVTVYVAFGQSGKGIGSRLYTKLLPALEERGLHTVLAGIALPNPASVTFHERFGFHKVAHLSQVGFKMQRWVDVGHWQLTLKSCPVWHSKCIGPDKSSCVCKTS